MIPTAPRELRIDVSQASPATGYEIPVPGAGLYISTRPPIGAAVAFDDELGTQIPIAEGDVLQWSFQKVFFFWPFPDTGTFRCHVLQEGANVRRSQPVEKKQGAVKVGGTSTTGMWRAQFWNSSNASRSEGRLLRVVRLLVSKRTVGTWRVGLGGVASYIRLSGTVTDTQGKYRDGRINGALSGSVAYDPPIKGEWSGDSTLAPSDEYDRRLTDTVPQIDLPLEIVLPPQTRVALWVVAESGAAAAIEAYATMYFREDV